MNVYLIHVTPMQHVITSMVVLAVLVSMVILEMVFGVLVSHYLCMRLTFELIPLLHALCNFRTNIQK